ncbi:FtsX-like permease family protein [Actinomadura sp. 1N219]|uniref:FtsX-like permease family protein n=1 Tax=Actinomadura sp. 1N219 TaxID=3375152 RepID=UPI003798FC3D
MRDENGLFRRVRKAVHPQETGMVSVLLGLRMALAGGREGLARLVLTAFGVALGVIFVLSALSAGSALQGRTERSAWQDTEAAAPATAPDAALWLAVSDHFAGRPVHRVHVAALGPRPPVPPGLDRLPAPGEAAVSPALRDLLAVVPSDQLGDRFPGRVTTTIGAEGLRHPDHLVAVVGHTPQDLRRRGGAAEVRGIAARSLSLDLSPFLAFAITVAAILLLVPVAVFVVMVARIGAARRERRLAAMRMVGATRSQTAVMAAAETSIGAVTGSVAGLLGFLALRPALARLHYEDYQSGPFFPADLTVPAYQIIPVVVAVPALAVGAVVYALNKVQVTPLGIGGGNLPGRPPSAWRLLPVLIGVAGLSATAALFRLDRELATQVWVGLVVNALVLCTMAGAAVSGPWACLAAGRVMARYSRKATTLMAARRIIAAPRTTYRAVGGVSLAVYIATLLAGTASMTATAEPAENLGFDGRQRHGVVEIYAGGEPDSTLAPLMKRDGVVVVRGGQGGRATVACAELVRVVDVRCPYPSRLETIHFPASTAMGLWATGGNVAEPGPGAANLPVYALYVPTDGSQAAVERLRTQAATLLPRAIVSTRDDTFRQQLDFSALFNNLGSGMRLVLLFVIVVAGCSLTIASVNGLIERRRPFALLRASGVRLGELRRVTMLETAVPMVLTVILGTVLGSVPPFAASVAQGAPYPGPGLDFTALLTAAVLACLAITTLVLPLMNVATRYDAVRFE